MPRNISTLYFNWLLDKVCDDSLANEYSLVLETLHDREFYWSLDMDANRAVDGIELRGRFAEETGYDYRDIRDMLGGPCSVLEMMVGLAIRCEEGIMGDGLEDNTSRWFWVMIRSLGLKKFKNNRFDPVEVNMIIDRLLERDYDFDGKGGLFTVASCDEDIRTVDIWYQLNWYLNSILDDS